MIVSRVVGLFVLAVTIHLLGHSDRPLWLDEACTYWTVQGGVDGILRGTRNDGTPPLYFLAVSGATRITGVSELALRLPSLVAAAMLVPLIYGVTLEFGTRRAAVIAAGLATTSPLVHYYSLEARNYAAVQLLSLLPLWSFWRALSEPHRMRNWAYLAFSLTILLYTHTYAFFLLPVPVVLALLVAGRDRWPLAIKSSLATLIAFLAFLPWLGITLESSRSGVVDWIVQFWRDTPPWAAILRSLEVFGVGGLYPRYLYYLGAAPSLRLLSIPLTFGILGLALLPLGDSDSGARTRGSRLVLAGFVIGPLLAAWVYSFVRQPIYLVGRYDTIALPAFLILFAVGLDKILRLRPKEGWLSLGAVAALTAGSLWTSFGGTAGPPPIEKQMADYLAGNAMPGDIVVCTGYSRAVVDYYLDRSGTDVEVLSFPPEIATHPGWYSAERLLQNRKLLASQGEELSRRLQRVAISNRSVWILASRFQEVDDHLYKPLLGRMEIDEALSRRDLNLYRLARRRP